MTPMEPALRLFGIPDPDLAAVLAAHDAVCREPSGPLADWVAAVGTTLEGAMGIPSPGPVLPSRSGLAAGHRETAEAAKPPETGAEDELASAVAYLPVVAFAEALHEAIAFHRRHDVPDSVTTATFADVGRMVERNRLWGGQPGLGDALTGWLTRHFHGALFQVGRLQVERVRMTEWSAARARQAGVVAQAGDLELTVHIPAAGGPLTPAAVDDSLGWAHEVVQQAFPQERYVGVSCHSWLLDPQLAEALPGSNVAAFAGRFVLGSPADEDGDLDARRFAFGASSAPFAELPTGSSLQRAVVELWRRGGHVQVCSGWLPAR